MLRRQKHVLSQSTTPFACTLFFFLGGGGKYFCNLLESGCTPLFFVALRLIENLNWSITFSFLLFYVSAKQHAYTILLHVLSFTHRDEAKGQFCKRAVLANVPSFRFLVPSLRFLYPRSGFWGPSFRSCTLVPV